MTRDNVEEMATLEKHLAQEFEIKDLGKLQYFLGIKVARSDKEILICQGKYILNLLQEIGMLGCKPVGTFIKVNHKLQGGVSKPIDICQYQRLVGRLIYLSHTKPNIAYVISLVSQYMHDPQDLNLDVILHILRYLKFVPGKGLLFSKSGHLKLEGFTNAN